MKVIVFFGIDTMRTKGPVVVKGAENMEDAKGLVRHVHPELFDEESNLDAIEAEMLELGKKDERHVTMDDATFEEWEEFLASRA